MELSVRGHWAWLALLALALTSGCSAAPFECQSNEACVHGGVQGMCESSGYCSFPDDSCSSSGRRYGPAAPDAGRCVEAAATAACVQQLSMGSRHSCARLTDGSVWCWGGNAQGQIGDASSSESAAPKKVEGLPFVTKLSSGDAHTCALTDASEIWCWGSNEHGQLGRPADSAPSPSPAKLELVGAAKDVSAGGRHTCAVAESGAVHCWGSNDRGQLGDGTQSASAPPKKIAGVEAAVAVDVGDEHSCALLADGGILCWGSNEHGQCGLGSPAPQSLLPAEASAIGGGAQQMIAGHEQTCIVRAGQISCWGALGNASVGHGLTVLRGVSSEHTCVLLERNGGELWCWGDNAHGQLGSGQGAPSASVPVRAHLPTVTPIGATGAAHACAVIADGSLWCWGDNAHGQLGVGALGGDYPEATEVAICP